MGIFEAFQSSISSTFQDQWKEFITAGPFHELTALAPGIVRGQEASRGANGVISKGSRILVPENTAAVVFDHDGIETIVTQPGGFVYAGGQESFMSGSGLDAAIFQAVQERFAFAGEAPETKRISFVNLREIRGIKFGTRGPLVYNDRHYGADLALTAYGTLAVRVVDPALFLRNFVPANFFAYGFDSPQARQTIVGELLQSLNVAINRLSDRFRITQLPAQSHEIVTQIMAARTGAGSWVQRFGLQLVNVSIENIQFTDNSRELIREYNENLMEVKAYEGLTQEAVNRAAQLKVAEGVQSHGFGTAGASIVGMNLAQSVAPHSMASPQPAPVQQSAEPEDNAASLAEQIALVKQLKELLDAGILTQEEFDAKKRDVLGFD